MPSRVGGNLGKLDEEDGDETASKWLSRSRSAGERPRLVEEAQGLHNHRGVTWLSNTCS